MDHRDDLRAWLTLADAPGFGRGAVRKLLAAHASAANAVAATPALRQHDIAAVFERTSAWLDATPGRSIVTLGDPGYPPLLLEAGDPPLLLYVQGRVELLAAESIAIVGSRNPTPQGRETARAMAAALSDAGLGVVSGLALGIDAAAHEGALSGPGSTVAVVGTGLDRVYPRAHHALAHRITEIGVMVSELPLGAPPLAPHFPQRNRIIAGLSRGTLVVEAALQSGSLITARLAAEAGREVFAVPGSIHSPLARGCHALIQQGAKLVLGVDDVLAELRPMTAPRRAPSATAAEPDDPLLAAMGYDPIGLDALSARTGDDAATLSARLLEFELGGRVARLPGQLFQRIARG